MLKTYITYLYAQIVHKIFIWCPKEKPSDQVISLKSINQLSSDCIKVHVNRAQLRIHGIMEFAQYRNVVFFCHRSWLVVMTRFIVSTIEAEFVYNLFVDLKSYFSLSISLCGWYTSGRKNFYLFWINLFFQIIEPICLSFFFCFVQLLSHSVSRYVSSFYVILCPIYVNCLNVLFFSVWLSPEFLMCFFYL